MKCMFNLTDKFALGITLFTQIIVSFLVDKKHKFLSLTGVGKAKTVKKVYRRYINLRSPNYELLFRALLIDK